MNKILLIMAMMLGLVQLSMSENTLIASTNGIEPIASESFKTTTASDGKIAVVAKKKKKGLGKIFSWVKTKSQGLTFKLKAIKAILFNEGEKTTKTHWGAITGFVTSIVSIFIAGIPLGLVSIVFSAIALNNIKNYPLTYSGKGLAIAGLVIGIIGLIGGVYYLTQINP